MRTETDPARDPEAGIDTAAAAPAPTRPKRRRRVIITSVSLAAAAAVVVTGLSLMSPAPADAGSPKKDVPTAEIMQGDLVGTKRIQGELAYANSRPFLAGAGGVITGLPDVGSVVGRGGTLYSVDNTPVILFIGDLPAWRPFQSGMDDGPDVQQLEQNLKDLGYFTGDPDQEFTARTAAAIKAWQKATGQEQTGSIDLGRIVFSKNDVRISTLDVRVGDQVGQGGALGTITDGVKNITANINLSDQSLAVVGAKVTVGLPGGITTTGTISAVGTPYETDGQGGKVTVIPITVVLDDPSVADAFQQVGASIDLTSQTATGVFYVPLNALLAIDNQKFAVQVVDKNGKIRTVPVTTGLFAGGNVEISGDIAAGEKVVIPAL